MIAEDGDTVERWSAIVARRALPVLLVGFAAVVPGCTSLRNEWSDKHGGPDVDSEVKAAVQEVLPESMEVVVGSHKNGFSQEMNVDVTLPNPSFGADALVATVRAICGAAELTDVVYLEVTDGAAGSHMDLAALVRARLPNLSTPYDPTQVQIEVEEDCAGL